MAMTQYQRTEWRRVSKQCPCPKCNHSTWCLIAPDCIMCMRVQGGKAHHLRDGSIGYIYPVGTEAVNLPPRSERSVAINARRFIDEWTSHTSCGWVASQAASLGVSPDALKDLECCNAENYHATAFPMKDGYGNTVGIRLRSDNGRKWAVTGSHQGIFLPASGLQRTVFVCEGPTDTAAALSIGLSAVGRPSCSGGIHDISTAFRRLKVNRAVIISDNDGPGLQGAEMLARHLHVPTATLVLPCKDMREFVNRGGTAVALECLLNDTVWRQP